MSGNKWFVIGCFGLGLVIGFMVGLSISPVVSTVLGLFFAFAGGSIIVLVKGRSENELALIGKSLIAIAFAMIIGIILGILLRTNDWLRFEKSNSTQIPFELERPLSINDIKVLCQKKVDPIIIRTLLKAKTKENGIEALKISEIMDLIDSGIHPDIIVTMLTNDTMLNKSTKDINRQKHQSTVLYTDPIEEDEFERDMEDK